MSVEFVDTKVLVYAHDRGMGPKQDRAIELMARLSANSIGAISVQVLVEFYSVATRKFGMTSRDAEDVIKDLSAWMTIHRPEPADRPRWNRVKTHLCRLTKCSAKPAFPFDQRRFTKDVYPFYRAITTSVMNSGL